MAAEAGFAVRARSLGIPAVLLFAAKPFLPVDYDAGQSAGPGDSVLERGRVDLFFGLSVDAAWAVPDEQAQTTSALCRGNRAHRHNRRRGLYILADGLPASESK